jgi:hypothetical protein
LVNDVGDVVGCARAVSELVELVGHRTLVLSIPLAILITLVLHALLKRLLAIRTLVHLIHPAKIVSLAALLRILTITTSHAMFYIIPSKK